MLRIAVVNESTAISDGKVQEMLPAFEQQWNQDLDPVWGVGSAKFTFIPKHQQPPAGSWWVVFLDNSDQADALAYHDLTNEGLPISKVFVKTLLADHASISVGATHGDLRDGRGSVDQWRLPGPTRGVLGQRDL